MHAAAALLLAMLVLAQAGCQRAATGDSLFPLEAGHRWTYRVVTVLDDGSNSSERETLTLRTLGSETLAIDDRPAYRRRSETGIDYWLRADASGIYRVASKTDLDEAPRKDEAPRFVLKAPFLAGTQWQAATAPYLLMRRNEFPREIRHSHPSVPMAYRIESQDEAVDVPAGHFDRCLRVKGSASVRLYADPVKGWIDMPLTTVEWYCPGVGLVRLERSEPARTAYVTGGTRTLELESWQ